MSTDWSFETRQIHAGQTPDTATGARALPIYQTTRYSFNDADHAADLFALEEFGNIYTRIMNPTQSAVEERIAASRAASAHCCVASGPGRRDARACSTWPRPATTSCPARASTAAPTTCSTTPSRSWASTVTFVDDPDDPEAWRAAVRPNTKAFFAETISNPKHDILDIEGVAAVAHEVGVPLIVDNTVATPVPDPADRVGRRHRGALGDQVPRRARHRDRRRDRRRRHLRLRRRPRAVPGVQHPGPQLPRPGVRAGPRRRARARREPGVHPQGPGAAAARPGPAVVPVQRLPHRPGHRDAAPAHGAARRERQGGGRVARGPRRGASRSPTRACPQPVVRAGAGSTRPKGAGAVLAFEIQGGAEAGRAFVDGPRAAQPGREHRRRARRW